MPLPVLFWSAVSLQLYFTACLDCYSCVNVAYVANCTSVIQCPVGFSCHATANAGTYTLGCKDTNADKCHVVDTTSTNFGGAGAIVGRSLTTAVLRDCTECCTSNTCNRQLCQTKVPVCQDSGHIDCDTVGSYVNLCAEKNRAKNECRRFCRLCSIVDGGWSAWTTWSSCSNSCGNGTLTRQRSCSDPAPAKGGRDCTGISHEVRTCSNDLCPVHGGWSDWGAWGYCSVTCGIGLQRRDRTCSHPSPSNSGDHCFGDARSDKICYSTPCHDGGWTDWGKWSACSKTCDFGTQKRSRSCSNPAPSILGSSCLGENVQMETCVLKSCTDGGWADWGKWTACSKTCDFGTQKRSRLCTNPTPSILGRTCVGDSMQVETCKQKSCAGHEQLGFTVYDPRDTGTSGRIRFATVITNIGGGYNTSTGIFTCTVAGVYSFSLHIEMGGSLSQTICFIYKNSLELNGANAYSQHPSTSGNIVASTTVFVHLVPGDEVYLGHCTAASTMSTGAVGTSFAGYLVHSD